MDSPAARLLVLLSLLQSRPQWTSAELADRLGTTDRTVRRDVARLRDLGYSVDADAGRTGGYRLGVGGALPPLLLTDDEAVAVAVGLRAAAERGIDGYGDAAAAALAKLDQMLPAHVRERVSALAGAALVLREGDTPGVDPRTLLTVAQACRRPERLTFEYRDGSGNDTERRVEPYGLVNVDRRWYVVAHDLDRDDWRTYRIDRISTLSATGHRNTPRDTPDAAALVSEGVAVRVFDTRARVRIMAPADVAARHIGPTIGVIEPGDDASCIVTIGGDADWIARYLISLEIEFDVLEPPEINDELRTLAAGILARLGGNQAAAAAATATATGSKATAATSR